MEFVRRKTWTSKPARLANGISAVTSLCVCDEASSGGPCLLISGDEDGGVSVLRLEGGSQEPSSSGRLVKPELQRVRLHSSCVNTIKVLPDQRGYVCAGDDGALTAVASFEAEIGRAALHLTGHSGFVTDCDTARTGHGILSSSTDGRMLVWDPVSSSNPVASVLVGRPVNSACFSAGDPYALVCAPGLGEARNSSRGGGSCGGGDLVQIWDLRFLKCFKDSVPAALAAAFGEEQHRAHPRRGPFVAHDGIRVYFSSLAGHASLEEICLDGRDQRRRVLGEEMASREGQSVVIRHTWVEREGEHLPFKQQHLQLEPC
eukprot:g18066.t1